MKCFTQKWQQDKKIFNFNQLVFSVTIMCTIFIFPSVDLFNFNHIFWGDIQVIIFSFDWLTKNTYQYAYFIMDNKLKARKKSTVLQRTMNERKMRGDLKSTDDTLLMSCRLFGCFKPVNSFTVLTGKRLNTCCSCRQPVLSLWTGSDVTFFCWTSIKVSAWYVFARVCMCLPVLAC